MLKQKNVYFLASSDPLKAAWAEPVERLRRALEAAGLHVEESPYLMDRGGLFSSTPQARAQVLHEAALDPAALALLDLSGGDMASELLGHLDWDLLKASQAFFYGYSDLTSIMQGLPLPSVWVQPLHFFAEMEAADQERQVAMQHAFVQSLGKRPDYTKLPYRIPVEALQGELLEGEVWGGNCRCLLKLAGTPAFPRLDDRILFLEAASGSPGRISAYFHQMKQMGLFDRCRGIFLGQFTELEARQEEGLLWRILKRALAGHGLPVFKTPAMGHGLLAQGLLLKDKILLSKALGFLQRAPADPS